MRNNAAANKLRWCCFPKNKKCPDHLKDVIAVFEQKFSVIDSKYQNNESNWVLAEVEPGLSKLGYSVEKGKKANEKVTVPVLFGENGDVIKSFDADAYSSIYKTVIEVEAGRGVSNYQFLKDLFESCIMVDVDYCVIAIRNVYRRKNDYDKAITFIEALFASNKLVLPLHGILIIGY